ncbi:hypothetical protein AAVH_39988 [Aphelenchoides avenae]|nr:hypothetical protein AAVH_39988 [Aphelenchus avenae]
MANFVPILVLIAIHIACVFIVIQCSRYFCEKKQLIRDNSGPLLRHTYSTADYGATMTCESGSNAMHFH